VAIVHRFDHENDGSFPTARLVQGGDGSLYGATSCGRSSIFRAHPSGAFTRLSAVGSNCYQYDPFSAVVTLMRATDGAVYGTYGNTVFVLDGTGAQNLLHRFSGEVASALVQEFDALTLDEHLDDISALTSDLGSQRYGPILAPQMAALAALHMRAVRRHPIATNVREFPREQHPSCPECASANTARVERVDGHQYHCPVCHHRWLPVTGNETGVVPPHLAPNNPARAPRSDDVL
jgi:hypothetical protein